MIEARYHDSVNVLQGLSLQKPPLQKPPLHNTSRQGDAVQALSPFDRAEWYQLLAEAGLPPLIAIATDENFSAALALTERSGRITPLRNWYSFTWRQIAPHGDDGDRLLVEIARRLKSRGHRVTLEPVPDEDGSATGLARAFAAAGWLVETMPCDINHVLNVKGRSFAEYWRERPGPLRTTIERKAKKVEISILTDFDLSAWQHYERIYHDSWKPAEDHPAMLRAFAENEGAAGRLRLGFAMHDGTPIAAQFWTVENGTAYIHKLAHLEAHKEKSAGTSLTAAMFEHVIERDTVSQIDFGNGNERYKADWMEEIRTRFRIDCINPGSPRGWFDLAKRAARRLRDRNGLALARGPVAS